MIVYGSRNYYKRKSSYRRDVCPSCGRPGHLHSYSATRCFHIYFIPIVPCGRRRVIDQCPSCEIARELPLREWNRLREHELRPSIETVRQDPANRENARKALSLVAKVGSKGEFAELVGLLAGRHNDDAGILATLGWCFHYFDMPNEGTQTLRQSLQIEENDNVRKLLAFHESNASASKPKPPSKLGQLLPVLIAPAIVVLALGFFLFFAFTGKPEQVFLVNGLEKPYDALVNGAPTRVAALGRARLPVEYGEIRVEPVDGGVPFEPIVESVEASFLNRGGKGPLVVINPDRTALLHWKKAVYFDQATVKEADAALQEESKLHVGESFYLFDDIDAAFEDLPDRVQLPSTDDFAYRAGVWHITDADPTDVITTLLGDDRLETAVAYGRQRLTFIPQDDTVLMLLASISDPGGMAAFLETKLQERPVLVEWHRYYQQAAANSETGRDLLAEYRALLENEPRNRDLTYLVGRLIENPGESLAMLEKATLPPDPSAYAFNAIAYHHMQRGDFAKALQVQRNARKLQPENLQFKLLEEEMLLATEHYDELIRRRRDELARDASNQDAAISLHALLALSNRKEEAKQVAADFLKAFEGTPGYSKELAQTIRTVFDATYAQSLRNLPVFARLSEKVGQGDWLYYAAVVNGDFAKANEILRESGSKNHLDQLLLYALATHANQPEFAGDRLAEAVTMLGQGLLEDKRTAEWFDEGAPAPGLEEVYANSDWPASSRVILTALGARFPRMKDVYFAAARKMCYDPVFPGLVLEKILAAEPSGVAPAVPAAPATTARP